MTIYYSKSTSGFYDTDFSSYTLPSDVVEITKDEHDALLLAQSNGQEIVAGSDGKPITQDHVQTDAEKQAALVSSARVALNKSDTVVIRCYSAGVAVPAVWQTYRSSLRAIYNRTDTTSTVLPTIPDYPEGT